MSWSAVTLPSVMASPLHACTARACRGAVGVALALLCAGCPADRAVGRVSWRVSFACEELRAKTERVHTQLRAYDCDGPVLYQAVVRRGSLARTPEPPAIGEGAFGFEATALDAQGRPLATLCRELTPAPGDEVRLVLTGSCDASRGPDPDAPPGTNAPPDPSEPPPSAPADAGCELGDAGCGDVCLGDPTVDSDGDGTPDCEDPCPGDPDKVAPGPCGCGTPDLDSDGDGALDCQDACPDDPEKTAATPCPCGVVDADSDGDGTPDCRDKCPLDPDKRRRGACGCGNPDVDTDGDGALDCRDECPLDPDKSEAGDCGCGVPDVDSDRDGTADCRYAPPVPLVQALAGRTLRVDRVTLNGKARTRVEVAPGDTVALRVEGQVVADGRRCPDCLTQLYVGLEGVMSLCLGSSVASYRFDRSKTLRAPGTPGVYFINTAGAVRRACITNQAVPRGLQEGSVATIVVRPAP